MLATFAAAFAGNVYYHLLLYWPELARGDAQTFENLAFSRLIYCLLLASGLCASFYGLLRKRGKTSKPGVGSRLLHMAGASLFFAVLHVWNYGESFSVGQRWDLCRSLIAWD